MRKSRRYSRARFLIILCAIVMGNILCDYCFAWADDGKFMTKKEYEAAKRGQDKFHALLHAGDVSLKEGNNQQAELYYSEAYKFAKGTSSEAVAQGKLARFYEEIGQYEKSLIYVDWFLNGLQKNEPSWQRYTDMKMRLLQKIKAQKSWETKQDPAVLGVQKSFPKSTPQEQKKFLESLGGKGVWDIFKEAMVAEHGGDFKKALGIYEGLIPRKTEVEKELGIDGWVMLYPAIQRNAELSKDMAKEKEALLWIKENLLPEKAPFHASLSKLLPRNVAHIEKRLKDYQL